MVFPTASSVKRPIRLSAKIRKWAWESLQGKYGTEAMETPYLNVVDPSFEELTPIEKYDFLLEKIAREAPIRICEEELVSGSATLGAAIWHRVPAFYKNKFVFSSISHLTTDYETTLDKGIDFYSEKIEERLKDGTLSDKQKKFLFSLRNVIKCLKIYHLRYLAAVKDLKPDIYENLLQVPFQPARTFHEAVQSIWFIFSFLRLTGNFPGIGRIDKMLGKYYENDVKKGLLTKEKAREILASFFIKGTEWIQKDTPLGSGDAQHYQNIVLSGIDADGNDVTNEVTYLVLDIIEELGISDYPVSVRVNNNTSRRLLDKVARVIRHGGGVVALYNEELVIKAMTNYGYPERDARDFANDGCWEVQVPGKTRFEYHSFDSLCLLQKVTLNNYENIEFADFEELYHKYISDLRDEVGKLYASVEKYIDNPDDDPYYGWFNSQTPCSAVSLFENDCIESAKSYCNGGAKYSVLSPHIGGIADTVNSLYAIKKLVFDEKIVSFGSFMTVLKNDWKGNEALRNRILSYQYYGTDNDEVDGIYARILHDFYLICREFDTKVNFLFPAGVSTFGRQIEWAKQRLSTPFGAYQGAVLAGNSSPTPGTDTVGATAVINSYCKADLSEMVTGTALYINISPTALSGKNGVAAIKSLILGFVDLGGYFLQMDTVSADTLRAAQKDPKAYKTLSVRVSGWNARFVTLTKEWQDMIIGRTEHEG